ncbi:hypothetical protein KVT40_006838 [Elsinoe batatas]|uniref:Uncharacterized protein n=1 Tax=Elsinoe batatas TaxID=2601811 RepID=A0A8K0KXC8_9PEZI|nr:hypothetical protein KVT40_006838 [Elsinoe batatas]
MRLNALLLLLSWSTDFAVDAFSIGRRADKQSKETFDQETKAFEKEGLCRSYEGNGDTLSTCKVYCNQPSNITCYGGVEVNGKKTYYYDPDGQPWIIGKCECKVPEIAVFLATEVLEAMPLVAGIGCTLLFGALQMVIDIDTTVIPGGAAVKGVENGVQAAKTLVENGNDAAGFTGWFSKVCNPTNSDEVARINADVGKFFDPLAAAADYIGVGAGCVLKDKSKCKKNDKKPNESSRDKQPDQTTKDNQPDQTSKTDESKTTTTDKSSTTDSSTTTTTTGGSTTTTDGSITTTDASKTTTNTDSSTTTTSTTEDSSACGTTTTKYAPAATDAVSVCKFAPDVCKNPDDLEAADFLDDVVDDTGIEARDLEKRSSPRPFNIALPHDEEIKMSSIPYVERPAFVEELRTTTDKDLYTKVFDYSNSKLDNVNCGMDPAEFKKAVKASVDPGKYADSGRAGVSPTSVDLVSQWMSTFRLVKTKSRLWEELASVRAELTNIETNGPASGVGLVALWDTFVPAYFQRIEEKTKEWYDKYLKDARVEFEKAKKTFDDDKAKRQKQCAAGKRPNDEPTPQYIEFTLKTIGKYEKMSNKLKLPKEKDLDVDVELDLPKDDAGDGSSGSECYSDD